jgi:hypothetical protein
VLEHHRGDPVAAGRGDPLQQVAGVHVPLEEAERGLRLAGRGRVQLALHGEQRGRGGEGVPGHRDDRGAGREAGREREDLAAGPLVQGEQDAGYGRGAGAVRGERADHQIGPVPRGDHKASRGQRPQEVRQHRAAEDEVECVTGEPRVVPEEHLAAERVGDLRDGGSGERGLVRKDVTGHRKPGVEPLQDRRPVLRGHPVHHHGEDVASQPVVGAVGVARLRAHRLGTLVPAADDRDHGRGELVRQAGVERELVGDLRAGEVGAEDEDDVVVAGDQVEPVDEGGDQLVGALLGLERGRLVVVHAVDRRRVLREPVAGPQQLEEPVRTVVHERTEHPHPVDLAGQQFHDSQFDDLTAVTPVDPGHVHAARHACSPSVSSPGRVWARKKGPPT